MNALDRAFLRGFRCGCLAVLFGWLVWLLYGSGYLAYLLCDRWGDDESEPDSLFHVTFRIWQRGMAWSYVVQEWIEGGVHSPLLPWGPPATEESP